ncbi:MAG: hypothetical protein COW00_04465 [Bdellovibrio sp. CG12_big_fil_rev_8_21_14_0_65_39_13]|nr:MAG: hypothetical protein COW78_12665 [Bdellovibrio sp. CG22_combo_CG10-13_8_21_14_all_39_27]PIQ61062.1 MAG: hypothetical protein COW00_04465 [Bdellovibrio sp. CG12_big_fil_rev_8_21_14_0_65_39_13]PIR36830.1 MAG: hypothetical protein COV37_01485 [Bdellovibrio sp. CG11_big_fil_rev_8_21_14_0_20_39_38]PJB52804.1 MAG: hypothetical protein CO099_10590 [Bdellovibrio sp. CG_4_9_14_3_um_filter_39_7]
MDNLPLHPAIVHLPLGLIIFAPILSLLFLFYFKDLVNFKRNWLIVVFLHLFVMGGALVAKKTGEIEEERVEKIIGHHEIHEHEEKAEFFIVLSIVFFLVSGAVLAPNKTAVRKGLQYTLLLGQLGLIAVGINVGHSGGEMVFSQGKLNVGGEIAKPTGQAEEGREDHDD